MTSLLRPSANSSSGTVSPETDSNSLASFHDSTFFKVLGRIDEESSFRASLSNMTSQDSSPSSVKRCVESNDPDCPAPLSPEQFGNDDHGEKNNLPSAHHGSSNNNGDNHNVTVVTTITNIEDPKMNATASAEQRQDRSSPIFRKSQTQSMSPNRSSFLSVPSSLSSSTSSHRNRNHLQQRVAKPPQRVKDEEQLKQENLALQRECEELESIVLQMKTEGNIFQVRTAVKLKNYRAEIERATLAKETLQNQCQELEDKIWSLRNETRLQQEEVWKAETKLRQQRKQQQQQQQKKKLSKQKSKNELV